MKNEHGDTSFDTAAFSYDIIKFNLLRYLQRPYFGCNVIMCIKKLSPYHKPFDFVFENALSERPAFCLFPYTYETLI